MKPILRPLFPLVAGLMLAACAGVGPPSGPPPLEATPPTPLPAAEVVLVADAPVSTPADARLEVQFFDEVAGFESPSATMPMQSLGGGTWSVRLTPPAGSLLYYRFVQAATTPVRETDSLGAPISTRIGLIDGPTEIRQAIAGWEGDPVRIPTGRIVGSLFNALDGTPLPDILVSAGGQAVFTDGYGAFRLDDLVEGLHSLVAVSPTGAYLPVQQGAILAADSETPAALGMLPATPIVVTFQVTVPPDTPPNAQVRVAGNILTLGHTFVQMSGGGTGSVGTMPSLFQVSPSTYLGVAQAYSGTNLRYRYTLGDGRWNTERNASGNTTTRELILPDHDITLADVVATWHVASGAEVRFHAVSAVGIPPSDSVSLQLRSGAWTEAIPMWPTAPAEWTYTLFGPLSAGSPIEYRYCRNQQCGTADDADTLGPNASGRQMTPASQPSAVDDSIDGWAWWQPDLPGAVVVAPEILPRPGYEAGYELAPAYSPSWLSTAAPALGEIAAGGANAVIFTPTWVLEENAPVPHINFDPNHAPLLSSLATQIQGARDLGMQVGLHPVLLDPSDSTDAWWSDARRDAAWWTVWFERYRAFLLTYARLGEQAGATKLVLGGPEIAPALPGGVLLDGRPSGVPADAEARWRALIDEVRAAFSGSIAFEIDFGQTLQAPPPFLDAVDQIHVYWHVPLGEGKDIPSSEMQAAAFAALDGSLMAEPALRDKPIYLSVEYLSIDGGATGCAPLPDGTCRSAQAFDAGADPDPDLIIDMVEQSDAMNAVLLAAYARESVHGFYARRYYPPVALHDKSASVHGKSAGQMLGYWYPRLRGP